MFFAKVVCVLTDHVKRKFECIHRCEFLSQICRPSAPEFSSAPSNAAGYVYAFLQRGTLLRSGMPSLSNVLPPSGKFFGGTAPKIKKTAFLLESLPMARQTFAPTRLFGISLYLNIARHAFDIKRQISPVVAPIAVFLHLH